jgi:hypothetical protein
MVDEPFGSPRDKGESSKELWSSRQEREDSGTMDILIGDNSEFRLDTTTNNPMPKEATQSDPPLGEPVSGLMEDIVEPPSAQKATRVPSWKRELTASC